MAETRSIERLFEAHARAMEIRREHGEESERYAAALEAVATLRLERDRERRAATRAGVRG